MRYIVLICTPSLTTSLQSYIEQLLQNNIFHIVVHSANTSEEDQQTFLHQKKCTLIYGKNKTIRADEQLKEGLAYCHQNFSNMSGVVATYATKYKISDIIEMGKSLSLYPNHLILGTSSTIHSTFQNRLWNLAAKWAYGKSISDIKTKLYAIPFSKMKWVQQISSTGINYQLNLLICALQRQIPIQEVPIAIQQKIEEKATFVENFRFGFTMLKGVFSYALSTMGAAIIDVATFYLLLNIIFKDLSFGMSLFLATIIARVISSLFNYWVNKTYVFQHHAAFSGSFVKYYILWLTLILLSYLLVYISAPLVPFIPVVWLKLVIDALLGILSYQVQLHWVFKRNR